MGLTSSQRGILESRPPRICKQGGLKTAQGTAKAAFSQRAVEKGPLKKRTTKSDEANIG
jgi:hypothetical protein